MIYTKKEIESEINKYLPTFPNHNNSKLAEIIQSTGSLGFMSHRQLRHYIGELREAKKTTQSVNMFNSSTVAIGCSHLPFQEKNQWNAMCNFTNWLSAKTPTNLVLAGDILDMNNISRHNKGNVSKITGLTLGDEYRLANKELDKFNLSALINKVYMYGNHENWYNLHMNQIDNAKLGRDVIKSPKEALKLVEKGFTVLDSYGQDVFKLGNLNIIHGDVVAIHAASKTLETTKQNTLFFHTHRMQQFTDSGPNNTQITGYNGGFAGDRTQAAFNYMPATSKNRWQNGFTVCYTDNEGNTTVNMLQWKNDCFIFNGHKFTATLIEQLY